MLPVRGVRSDVEVGWRGSSRSSRSAGRVGLVGCKGLWVTGNEMEWIVFAYHRRDRSGDLVLFLFLPLCLCNSFCFAEWM